MIDTPAKRVSATILLKPYSPISIFPDNTIDAGDRQAASSVYSGILADSAAPGFKHSFGTIII
jgi:hypothetical protein